MATKVLIVEDDDSFRVLMQTALEIYSYDFLLASNAEEAIDLINGNTFDIILTDITLGGMTGLELTEWIRQTNSIMPIVAVSGHSDSETLKNAIDCGISDYIVKPFRIKELPTIIERNLV